MVSCFVRKNKTLRSSFLGTTSVMDLLEANFRTWCAQNDVTVDDSPLDTTQEEGENAMEVEETGNEGDEDVWNGIEDEEEGDDVSAFFKEESELKAKLGAAAAAAAAGRKGRKRKGRVSELVRAKVVKILEVDTQLSDQRARMLGEGDFLQLLWRFNEAGIHFS